MDADLLLLGAGHAHLHVLERLARRPLAGRRVLLVTADPSSVYSGMVPGLVAGQYDPASVRIPVAALAAQGGVEVLLGEVAAIDPLGRRVGLSDGRTLGFGLVSLNVGATVAGLDLPGVRLHALPTRPIGIFVERLLERLRDPGRRPSRVAVVGGGAAGVELAFAVRSRLSGGGARAAVTLVHGGVDILEGSPPGLVRRIRSRATEMGIEVLCRSRVTAVREDAVEVEGGGSLPTDLVVWATGAEGHAFLGGGRLPTDGRGFIPVRETLQVLGHDHVLAAGDCAVPLARTNLPRAGVHAVRQGPVLAANLEALLTGGALTPYVPRRDALALLNLGDGSAAGSKWGRSFGGRGAMRWKDWLDRRFVSRFADGLLRRRSGRPCPTRCPRAG